MGSGILSEKTEGARRWGPAWTASMWPRGGGWVGEMGWGEDAQEVEGGEKWVADPPGKACPLSDPQFPNL